MTIAEFLTARLDELEPAAVRAKEASEAFTSDTGQTLTLSWQWNLWVEYSGGGVASVARDGAPDPTLVLADIAAKRAIVAEHVGAEAYYRTHTDAPAGELTGLGTAVRLLAQPYADHPDFDPAWRV